MFGLPSFMTFPWSLPSLPSISLPANIQRRFLSYVLKKSLGRFVRAGGLDVERIQAQIGEGWVEIEGLELDTEETNELIPDSIPLRITSGKVSKVNAKIPFPNLWSDPLSITLDTLVLELDIQGPASPKGKSTSTPRQSTGRNLPYLSPSIDLASSVTTAADEFLHEELDAYEEAELDRSIRQSIILNQNDPFKADEGVPGAFPFPTASTGGTSAGTGVESTTVLAGLVERVLTRLEFKVNNVKLRIKHADSSHGAVFELRIGQISYADETPSTDLGQPRKTTRVVRVSAISTHILPLPDSPVQSPIVRYPTVSRSSSTSSTASSASTKSDDDSGSMFMSMAVADLRHSMSTSVASGASVYQSAISEREEEDSLSVEAEPEKRASLNRIRSITPTPVAKEPEEQGALLFSFGSEGITFTVTTTQPSSEPSSPLQNLGLPPDSPQVSREKTTRQANPAVDTLPLMVLDFSMGTLAGLVLPSHTALIISALQAMAQTGPREAAPTAPSPDPASIVQPRVKAGFRAKALFFTTIYDLSAGDHPNFISASANFFAKPSTTEIPFGHLRLRLEEPTLTYKSSGFIPKMNTHRSNNQPSTLPRPSRRMSSGPRQGPTPPTVRLGIADLSIFEYLATAPPSAEEGDAPPGGFFPVLIFDANLSQQYDAGLKTGRAFGHKQPGHTAVPISVDPVFPEFDGVDWRNSGLQRRGLSSEKAWKVRQKGKGVLKGTTAAVEATHEPVIVVNKQMSDSPAIVETLPIHLFLDLSLVERLLPFLRHISPAFKTTHVESPETPTMPLRPHVFPSKPTRPPIPPTRSSSYVLDDLDAQASSPATIQPAAKSMHVAVITCPLLRLSVRCPAPPNRRGTWGDGAHLRSGIVTLDVHTLRASIAASSPPTSISHRTANTVPQAIEPPSTSVQWKKMMLFFNRVPEKRSSAFLIVGPLAPDPNDLDQAVLLPSLKLRSSIDPVSEQKTSLITCSIPSVQAKIRQPTIEGLQFFADDLTHWLDGAFGDGSRPKPRDELKMIGSRFFGGSKGSSSASSSAIEDEDEAGPSATIIRLAVTEVDVTLLVPRQLPQDQISASAAGGGERVLSLKASDVDIAVESNTTGRLESIVSLTVMDAVFADRTESNSPKHILARTTPLTLTLNNHPILQFKFTSLSDSITGTKESGISLIISSATIFITRDLAWIEELATFAKTPEGVFEDVVPSEVTRVHLQLFDTSAHVKAPNMTGAVVLVLGNVDVKTDLISDSDENTLSVSLSTLNMLAVDDIASTAQLSPGQGSSVNAWRLSGYVPMVEVASTEVMVWRDTSGSEEVAVDVDGCQVKVTACADSLALLGPLIGDLATIIPSAKADTVSEMEVKSPTRLDRSINVFDSIDEDAFKKVIPEMISGADLIEDDLPTNLDYLDTTTSRKTTSKRVEGESLRSWQATSAEGEEEVGGETIKVLYEGELCLEENYWETLPVVAKGDSGSAQSGKLRVRLHDTSLNILLYEGYDWVKTRKAIEDEIKTVRRKLERIRQLLASGQQADESIEQTRSVLFNSVYIGLDESKSGPIGLGMSMALGRAGEMNNADLLAAIDEELDEMGNDTASQSSWQTDFPNAQRPPNPTRSSSSSVAGKKGTRLRGKRLTRSKKPQIEISLQDIRTSVDLYDAEDPTASRLHAQVKSLEILDHIKTSTWKKFLTDLKGDGRGNVRETDADMVRIELSSVRPNLPHKEEEKRLKAKILPLRLHVDQDALDFLKRFFSFKAPTAAQVVVSAKTTSSPEPFFQHIEIFPIELKLDYKPKRVDFTALREGKTIELMNFFHFDAAEMTLRHVTISGLSGWDRLSTTLQDIWTPDVKANQLADVISGVSPIRSMVNVGSGVADLILLPIEQYRKDGRVARGVQRGTNSFVKSTALEMMKLGARLATGTQVILEKAETVLGGKVSEGTMVVEAPGASSSSDFRTIGGDHSELGSEDDGEMADVVSRYANQPLGAREGVQAAYKSLSKNVNAAAQTILAVPMEVYERSSDDGPLRAVVRAVPIAVLKPMIGASEAVSKTLLGMRNSLDPEGTKELGDKYK